MVSKITMCARTGIFFLPTAIRVYVICFSLLLWGMVRITYLPPVSVSGQPAVGTPLTGPQGGNSASPEPAAP